MINLYFCNFQKSCPAFYIGSANCKRRNGLHCKLYKDYILEFDKREDERIENRRLELEEATIGDLGLLRCFK